jgi:4-amino-4-deoxy-L-arabinose transferase-like glycosyltransferase
MKKILDHFYRQRYMYLLFICAYFGFFYGIGHYPLSDNNEGLYASIARDMFSSGNYLIPHLNGVPYIEKPPLLYWLMAISYHTFGINEFAARLIPSLSSIILCLSIFLFLSKVKNKTAGFYAAIIFASSFGIILIGRIIFFDMLLTTCLSLSLLFFYLWWTLDKKKYLRFSYLFLTLTFFAKGAVGVILIGGIIFAFLIFSKTKKARWFSVFYPAGLLFFSAAIIAWTLLCSTKLPHFAWDTFINEQLYRFLNKRIPRDYYNGSVFYYIPRIIIYLLPWGLLLPALFFKKKEIAPKTPSLNLFLWVWFLVPFFVFSLGGNKANYYMIVGMPPLIILLSEKITFLAEKYLIAKRFFWAIVGSVLLSLIITLHILPSISNQYSQKPIAQFILKNYPSTPFYLYQDFENYSSIAFYFAEPLPIIDSESDDLYYGQHQHTRNDLFITPDQFLNSIKDKKVLVLVRKNQMDDFKLITHQLIQVLYQTDKTNLVLLQNNKQ